MWSNNSFFTQPEAGGFEKLQVATPVQPSYDKQIRSWRDEVNDIIFELGESNSRQFEQCMLRLEALEESMDDVLRSKNDTNHSSNRAAGKRQEHLDFEDLPESYAHPV